MKNPRVVFAGTPEFALASLQALVAAGVEPLAVYTQPDRPRGRGRKQSASPVKAYAAGRGFPVRQPRTLRDAAVHAELEAMRPDLLIVAAYGKILPPAVLGIPVHGCLNVHASLLPRWRGAAPIQAAIMAGDARTGISLMQMAEGLDTGPVYVSREVAIDTDMTAGELHDVLAETGGALLVDSLDDILSGRMTPRPQDEQDATYAARIATADAVIDWQQPASALQRQVRAYNPVPGARFDLDGEPIKCWRARVLHDVQASPGTVVAAGKQGVDVACGDEGLRLLEVQRPGRGRISGREFAAQLPLTGRVMPSATN